MATPLLYALFVWALVTVALITVAAYRGFLTRSENDRIILSKGEDRLVVQQQEIISKASRLDGIVKGLAFACGGLLLICTAVWIWSSLASL